MVFNFIKQFNALKEFALLKHNRLEVIYVENNNNKEYFEERILTFEFQAPLSVEDLSKSEQKYGVIFPGSYKQFMLSIGPCSIFDSYIIPNPLHAEFLWNDAIIVFTWQGFGCYLGYERKFLPAIYDFVDGIPPPEGKPCYSDFEDLAIDLLSFDKSVMDFWSTITMKTVERRFKYKEDALLYKQMIWPEL